MWSRSPQTIRLQLSYRHGEHRYVPKLSRDGRRWQPIAEEHYAADTTGGTATLTLELDGQPLWISAQELFTVREYRQWADSLAARPFVTRDTVGYSHQQRPVERLRIAEVPEGRPRGVLILTGRLHPPEVTGQLAAGAFIEELASGSELAKAFRRRFEVWSYPFANPDGVQNGHWRHNGAGVDLNRDWTAFNQPEPRAIRDDLLPLQDDSLRKVYYGIDFHSTDEDIFYPIERDIETFPDDFTFEWLDALKQAYPDHPFEIEPFDTSSPITKNWIYRTFGADALTYEVNDTADRRKLKAIARRSAQLVMQGLLERMASVTPAAASK